MIPFQERKKFRKIMYSKVALFVLLVVLFVVGRGTWDIYQKTSVAQTERDIAMRALADIQSRTTELQDSFVRLRSDRGIEEEVRQKYTVARPWEEVVVVVDDGEKIGKNGEAEDTKSLWQRFITIFRF